VRPCFNDAPVQRTKIPAAATAATDTVAYLVTDQSGLTSTSTRTVIIEPPAPSIIPSDNTATTTEDNAATSTTPDTSGNTQPTTTTATGTTTPATTTTTTNATSTAQ
jgi:hypothetical protein